MYSHYGIAMLKPDGANKTVEHIFMEMLHEGEIIIEKRIVHKLTAAEVKLMFLYQFKQYTDFLSSGKSIFYLVSSHHQDITAKLLSIKDKIRSIYRCTSKNVENIIHTANTGTEFYLQSKIFKLADISATGYNHHIVVPDSNNIWFSQICNVGNMYRLKGVALCFRANNTVFQTLLESPEFNRHDIKISFHTNKKYLNFQYEIIYFFSDDIVNASISNNIVHKGLGIVKGLDFHDTLVANCSNVDEFINEINNSYHTVFATIRKIENFDSILRDCTYFTLQEVIARDYYANMNDLYIFGGSGNDKFHTFTVNYQYDGLDAKKLFE